MGIVLAFGWYVRIRWCHGLNSDPLAKYVHVPAPETVSGTLFEKHLYRWIQCRVWKRGDHPGLSRWILSPMTSVLARERTGEDTDMGRRPCEGRGRDPRDTAQARQEPAGAGGGWKEPPLEPPTREPALLTPSFWTSGLPGCERVHFPCFKHPSPPTPYVALC